MGRLGQSGAGVDQFAQTPLGALYRAEQARFPGVDGGDQSAEHLPHPLVLTFKLGGGTTGDAQFLRLTLDHGGQLLDLGDQSAGAATVAASTFKARQCIVELVEQGVVAAAMMIRRAARRGSSTFNIAPARTDFETARHRDLQYP